MVRTKRAACSDGHRLSRQNSRKPRIIVVRAVYFAEEVLMFHLDVLRYIQACQKEKQGAQVESFEQDV